MDVKTALKNYKPGVFSLAKKAAYETGENSRNIFREMIKLNEMGCSYSDYYQNGVYKMIPSEKAAYIDGIAKQTALAKYSSSNGVSIKEATKAVDTLIKKYNIGIITYLSNKLYEADKEKAFIESEEEFRADAIKKIAQKTGQSEEEVAEKMDRICSELEITYKNYYNKNYYNLLEMDILVKQGLSIAITDKLIQYAASKSGNSFEHELYRINKIKEMFGVPTPLYISRMYYSMTEEEIVDSLTSPIDSVIKETGWSNTKAKSIMARAKTKYNVSFARYNYARYYQATDEEIVEEEYNARVTRYEEIKKHAAIAGKSIKDFYGEMRLHCLKYGDPEDYYLGIQFYNIPEEERDNYLHGIDGDRILPQKYNTQEGFDLLYDKKLFNEVFDSELNRRWWVNEDGCTYEGFAKFAEGLDEIFVKPISSSRGRGCRKIKIENNLEDIYNDIIEANELLLVEQCLTNHPVIAQFGGGGLSTIRALVVNHEGKVDIISAYLRIGSNAITDNISVDGVAVSIDIETGITNSDGIDKAGKAFETEKCSGLPVRGVQVPFWEEAKQMMYNTMKKLEGKVGYAGLDVAITKDGPVLIEGNSHAHLHRNEFFDGKTGGHRYMIEKYV